MATFDAGETLGDLCVLTESLSPVLLLVLWPVTVPMFSGLSSLLTGPWWTWDPTSAGIGDVAYRWFNLAEAAAWSTFGLMVFRRWQRHRHSGIEVVYAAAFVLFGLTDVREAWQQSAWLLAAKGAVLAGLLKLRSVVRQRYYPESRLL